MKEINSLQEYNEFIKENKVIVGKVCITDITDVTEETKVQNAPTLFFYQDGSLIEKRHGKLEWEDIDEIYYH